VANQKRIEPKGLHSSRHDRAGILGVLGISAFILAISARLVLVSGCRTVPALTPQQAEGQHLYQTRCAHCHEDNDLGLKPAPSKIHGVLQQAKLPSGTPASDAVVRNQIMQGKGKMPAFQGRFTDPQMKALLAYLHTSMPDPDSQPN
jgi:mono/diheme cytochrome c family protein